MAKVKSYKRRGKNGKMITVRAYSRKGDEGRNMRVQDHPKFASPDNPAQKIRGGEFESAFSKKVRERRESSGEKKSYRKATRPMKRKVSGWSAGQYTD